MSLEVDDWIVKKLFGKEAEERLTDHEFARYLQELSSCGVEQLSAEPERLVEEKAQLLDDTENLAFANYKTFIQAANCSKEIYDDFTLVDEHVNGLVCRLPDLATQCRAFLQEANKIGGRRASNNLALSKHPQILEVLEIPQVMDTCVRAGYWEEALELAQFVSKLQRRLSDVPVIQSIAVEVESQRKCLIEQLLDQLHTQLSLPQCLKVVGYLRRMAVFTEAELRIKMFLRQARDTWLRSVLGAIPADDPYVHVTRVMEQTRVHLFDIVTQYRAVFSDDDPISTAPSLREQLPTNLPAIFHSWIGNKVQEFVQTLETDLAKGVGARLDSVLAQSMYFGLSFGRVGIDFRAMVVPIFENAAFQYFFQSFHSEANKFVKEISHESFLDKVQVGSGGSVTNPTSALSPPTCLIDWPSLAVLCNCILNAFNTLRLCAPIALAQRVAHSLSIILMSTVDAMDAISQKHRLTWSPVQITKFKRACGLLVNDLAPFLNRCLEAVFPIKTLATMLGCGVHNYPNLERKCRLNLNELRKPIEEFCPDPIILPAKEDESVNEENNPQIEVGSGKVVQGGIVEEVDGKSQLVREEGGGEVKISNEEKISKNEVQMSNEEKISKEGQMSLEKVEENWNDIQFD